MEIEKEENIVVRYIPQYIVIETRYKSLLSKDDQQHISKTTTSTKYASAEKFELGNSFRDPHFDQYEVIDYSEDHDDNELIELKQIDTLDVRSVDITDSKPSTPKRKYNSKASKLLNDWFLSHLHVRCLPFQDSVQFSVIEFFYYRIPTLLKRKKMP